MDGSPRGRRLRQRLGCLRARVLVTDRSGGAGPISRQSDLRRGESSRVHLLRCTALDVLEHAFAPVRGAMRVAPAPA